MAKEISEQEARDSINYLMKNGINRWVAEGFEEQTSLYREQVRRRMKNEFIVSGLVALSLFAGIAIADTVIEQKPYTGPIPSYGIR